MARYRFTKENVGAFTKKLLYNCDSITIYNKETENDFKITPVQKTEDYINFNYRYIYREGNGGVIYRYSDFVINLSYFGGWDSIEVDSVFLDCAFDGLKI